MLLLLHVARAIALALLSSKTSSYHPERESLSIDENRAYLRRRTLLRQAPHTTASSPKSVFGGPPAAGARRLRKSRRSNRARDSGDGDCGLDCGLDAEAIFLISWLGATFCLFGCSIFGCCDPRHRNGLVARACQRAGCPCSSTESGAGALESGPSDEEEDSDLDRASSAELDLQPPGDVSSEKEESSDADSGGSMAEGS